MKQGQWKQRSLKWWRESIKPMLIIVLVMFAFRSAIADWNDVPTGSMNPTIIEGDRVFVNKLAYDLKIPFTRLRVTQWGNPKRGDVVVFFSPVDEIRLVKRVVGLPGDRIELANNQLLVNGEPVKYEPLDQKIINEIPANQQSQHQFATELLAKHPHPVMATPLRPSARSFGPITVPAGQFFMMGDNRDNSFDSRFYGCVERKRIVGRASAVVISLDHEDYYLPRWHRFFTGLP
ncbi:MAG: signal peptidase I [Verrucomicrobia bacterium]|nr:signal peptidase I [Verrucomicrobiota bacterium]